MKFLFFKSITGFFLKAGNNYITTEDGRFLLSSNMGTATDLVLKDPQYKFDRTQVSLSLGSSVALFNSQSRRLVKSPENIEEDGMYFVLHRTPDGIVIRQNNMCLFYENQPRNSPIVLENIINGEPIKKDIVFDACDNLQKELVYFVRLDRNQENVDELMSHKITVITDGTDHQTVIQSQRGLNQNAYGGLHAK